jgi:hypothetical protein
MFLMNHNGFRPASRKLFDSPLGGGRHTPPRAGARGSASTDGKSVFQFFGKGGMGVATRAWGQCARLPSQWPRGILRHGRSVYNTTKFQKGDFRWRM